MKCSVCYSNNYTEIGIIKNIWDSDKKVYQCNDCKLYYIEPPTEDEMNNLYKNEYHKYWLYHNGNNKIKNKIFEYAKFRIRYSRSLSQFKFVNYLFNDIKNKHNIKVCEIGAFDGLLLKIFKDNGFSVYGYELNDYARNYAENKYSIKLESDFLSSNEKYDIIMLSHVLEHFVSPRDILLKIKSMLNDNGYLYIEVPNSPMREEVDNDILIDCLTTEHTVNFNPYNLKMLLESVKFEIVDIKYSNYNVDKDNISLKADILKGNMTSLKNIVPFSIFGIKTFIFPSLSFVNYDCEKTKWSYGENIRLIAKNVC
ncbi:methyltransferase [Brachyspira hampsonii]|uniref:Methyltransferase n=1 Tax=Brachyspira hampsonii TaxID=1287055 RepID=A0A1E5NIN1_9SPIR|nr:class I SAM-dependent methyltransferase [Brachyspira hampsonii]OEJ16018.1 methyltransferase [Brachyspira hampsonii]